MQELEVLRQIADQLAGLDLHKTIGYAVAFAGLVLVWLAIKWTGKAMAAVARGGWRLVKWMTTPPEPSQLYKDLVARLDKGSHLSSPADKPDALIAGSISIAMLSDGYPYEVRVDGTKVGHFLTNREKESLAEIVKGIVAWHRAEARRVAISQAREKINVG